MTEHPEREGKVWCLDCVWMEYRCDLMKNDTFWVRCKEYEPRDTK
jgi:hypothetical protein